MSGWLMLVLAVVYALAIGYGLWLVATYREPSEFEVRAEALRQAVDAMAAQIGAALLPVFQRTAAAVSALAAALTPEAWDVAKASAKPDPDPNPFPRFHLFGHGKGRR